MAKHEIIKNIPLPPMSDIAPTRGSVSDLMEVGDCILGLTQTQAHARAGSWNRVKFKGTGRKFRGRKLPDDVFPHIKNRYGIWQVA